MAPTADGVSNQETQLDFFEKQLDVYKSVITRANAPNPDNAE